MLEGLVFIGKIIQLDPIDGADFIVSATVICGKAGKWRGVVKKEDFFVGCHCTVFLHDTLFQENDPRFQFMKKSNWRVKMMRFKGSPSEVLIMPKLVLCAHYDIGHDVTMHYNVSKYVKPVPMHLSAQVRGNFPEFIPKTDEPNWQRYEDGIEKLKGHPYLITLKLDGSSTTAYKWKGHFGVCSRNLELKEDPVNGFWHIANRYKLRENLPEGIAIQWETCGPKINGNRAQFKEICGFGFSGYNIEEKRFLTADELYPLFKQLRFPCAYIIEGGQSFNETDIEALGQIKFPGRELEAEGVVVRSTENLYGHAPVSFKVLNLKYET